MSKDNRMSPDGTTYLFGHIPQCRTHKDARTRIEWTKLKTGKWLAEFFCTHDAGYLGSAAVRGEGV